MFPRRQFMIRLMRHGLISNPMMLFSIMIGVLGCHYLGRLAWLDLPLNAAMILVGMRPVNAITSIAGKWFVSTYALYAGMAFLAIAGAVMAPIPQFLYLDGAAGLGIDG